MKILLITAYFPPDTGSAAHLFYELGGDLIKNGYEVTVVTSLPFYHIQGDVSRYRGRRWMIEKMDDMKVVRAFVPKLPRHIPLARGIWQFSTAFIFSLIGLRIPKFDISIVYSPPLPVAFSAWWLKRFKNIPFILNVQDLFPQSAIDLGILKNRFLIKVFEAMERFIYREANYITVHSEGNRQYVISKGAESAKVVVVPNWVDLDSIKPSEKLNEFRKSNGLNTKFIVSFAGIMGYSQDLETVLESAALLKLYEDIIFLLVGDGVKKKNLEKKAKSANLTNVKFIPMQPKDKYPLVLSASDICLVTLKKEVRTPVVPSKLLNIMASGRPVIASLNLNGDVPKIVEAAKCGYCIESENSEMLSQSILKLYNEPFLKKELGMNGRRYAEEHFSQTVCVKKYEQLFFKIHSLAKKCN